MTDNSIKKQNSESPEYFGALKSKKCIIFDLDGTLVNTIDDLGIACDILLEKAGRPLKWSVDDYKGFVGNGAKLLVKRAFENTLTDDELEYQYSLFKKEYNRIKLDHAHIYPGILETVKYLKEKGKILVVCTNKPDIAAKGMISTLFGENVFDAVQGALDDVPKKPDPTAAQNILNSFAINSEDCVWIGDSDVDIKTAKNLGCVSIGVLWGFRSRESLEISGADCIIDEPKKIKTFF